MRQTRGRGQMGAKLAGRLLAMSGGFLAAALLGVVLFLLLPGESRYDLLPLSQTVPLTVPESLPPPASTARPAAPNAGEAQTAHPDSPQETSSEEQNQAAATAPTGPPEPPIRPRAPERRAGPIFSPPKTPAAAKIEAPEPAPAEPDAAETASVPPTEQTTAAPTPQTVEDMGRSEAAARPAERIEPGDQDRPPLKIEDSPATVQEARLAFPPGPRGPGTAQRGSVFTAPEPAWRAFAGNAPARDNRPRIAIVVRGLGQSSASSTIAIRNLPPAVSLSFAPESLRLREWIALARAQGHEVLIDATLGTPALDETAVRRAPLPVGLDSTEVRRRLSNQLERTDGFVGMTAVIGRDAALSPGLMRGLYEALAVRGLILVDLLPQPVAQHNRVPGLPVLSADIWIDAALASREAVRRALYRLESIAAQNGRAIGVAQPFPVTLEILEEWSAATQERGFQLVPVTALIAAPAPLNQVSNETREAR